MSFTPPSLDIHRLRRLTFVRQLHGIGIRQVSRRGPSAALGLLSLHDAVEMYLLVLSDLWNVQPSRKTDFLQYFKLLDEAGLRLVRYESMSRLNTARVALKHNGIAPGPHDIEALAAAATNFFEDNSPTALGRGFDQISLSPAVTNKTIRDHLEQAERALVAGELETALAASAVAFVLAIGAHNSPILGPVGERRAYSVQAAALRGATLWDARPLSRSLSGTADRSAERLGEAVVHSAEVFGEAIAVLGHGLDFPQYLQFKSFSPVVHVLGRGNASVQWVIPATDNVEIVRESVAFAIDAALILGERPPPAPPLPDSPLDL